MLHIILGLMLLQLPQDGVEACAKTIRELPTECRAKYVTKPIPDTPSTSYVCTWTCSSGYPAMWDLDSITVTIKYQNPKPARKDKKEAKHD